MPLLRQFFEEKRPLGPLHRKTMDLFRKYLIVGGMPQAVKKFVDTGDFTKTDRIKRDIIDLYRADTVLLISMAFDARTIVSEEIYRKLLLGKLEFNKGMLMENIVAQMLRAAGHRLFFYTRSSRL